MAKKTRPRGIGDKPYKPRKEPERGMTESMRLAHESLRAEGLDPYDPQFQGPGAAARSRAKRKSKGGDERSARAYKAWETRRANGGIGSGREKRVAVRMTERQKRYGRYRGHGNLSRGVRICMDVAERLMPMPDQQAIGEGEDKEVDRLIRMHKGESDGE